MMLLSFPGDLSIRTAEDLRSRLSDALSSEDDLVELDCSSAETVDLSFIQLLISARKSAEASGRRVRLRGGASGALKDALVRSGVLLEGGVSAEDGFWTEGGA